MMNKILVAIDTSEHSIRAISKAKDLAKAFDSEVILVNVVELIDIFNVDNAALAMTIMENMSQRQEASDLLLADLKKDFEALGITVKVLKLEGDPPRALLECIQEEVPDLVILGSHGVKGIKHFTLGSVVSRVAHHADTSVMIVR